MNRTLTVMILAVAAAVPAMAQTSPNFNLKEHTINAGGHPEQFAILTSASFRVTLDAIGDGVVGSASTSTSYVIDGGFIGAYPPPGEVTSVMLLPDRVGLEWDPEKSVGTYNLYRGLLSTLSGLGYGGCLQINLADESALDASLPLPGDGYFYLVTAENRLAEEGTKGFDSAGVERAGLVCP